MTTTASVTQPRLVTRASSSSSLLRPYDDNNNDDHVDLIAHISNGMQREERIVEDDIEDLISIPVAQRLKPKRSKNSIATFLPSASSSSSLASSFRAASVASDHPLEPLQPYNSAVQAPTASAKVTRSRGASPEDEKKSKIPQAASRRRPSGGDPPEEPTARKAAKREGLSRSSTDPSLVTLAANAPPVASSARPKSTKPGRQSPGVKRFPASTSSAGLQTASLPIASSDARKRAQTSNYRGPRAGPRSSPSKTNRVASGGPRRRSFSATARGLEDEEFGPTPPWVTAAAPVLYRTADGGIGYTGRVEDMLPPVVARKLEAERLAKLDQQDSLIENWGPDGLPRSTAIPARPKPKRPFSPVSVSPPLDIPSSSEEFELEERKPPPPLPSPAPPVSAVEPERLSAPSPRTPTPVRNSKRLSNQKQVVSLETPATPRKVEEVPPPIPTKDVDADKAGCCRCSIM